MKIVYYIVFLSWYFLSLLPLRVLYALSDVVLFPLLFHVVRYRRKVVRANLATSFPKASEATRRKYERQFYRFFCEHMVEILKIFSMSKKQMMRRMTFSGTEKIVRKMEEEGKNFAFVYLGHFCNWEWIASLPYWVPSDIICSQIYHPLYNKDFDRLFLRLREQYGGRCIGMKETLRRIIEMKRAGEKSIIGFISDQAPKWESIHHFSPFFGKETAVFTGTEQLAKQLDALVYYADVRRVSRGHYHCAFHLLSDRPKQVPDYELTDRFTLLLEDMIRQAPGQWLWTHKRWKRTKEEWEKRMGKQTTDGAA